jgi:hypothetical protein
MQPITVETLRNDHTFRYELLSQIQQLTEATGGGANATLLSGIKDAIDGIVPLIDGLELITGNIKIEAKTINLATDQVEDKLTKLSDLLTTLNSVSATTSADTGLIQTAVKNALAVLKATQLTIDSDLPGIRSVLDDLLQKVSQVYGATSNVDSAVTAMELRGRPPIAAVTTTWDVQKGIYQRPADPLRKMVRINNNSGNTIGRQAATAFVGYDGVKPDQSNYAQVISAGGSMLLDAPTLEFAIDFQGEKMMGTITIVEYGEPNNAGS